MNNEKSKNEQLSDALLQVIILLGRTNVKFSTKVKFSMLNCKITSLA